MLHTTKNNNAYMASYFFILFIYLFIFIIIFRYAITYLRTGSYAPGFKVSKLYIFLKLFEGNEAKFTELRLELQLG